MSEVIWGQNRSSYRKNSSTTYNIHAGDDLRAIYDLPTDHIPLDIATYEADEINWIYTVSESSSAIDFDDNTLNLQYLLLHFEADEYHIPLSNTYYSHYFTAPEIKSTRLILNDFFDAYVINFVEAVSNSSSADPWVKSGIFIHRFTIAPDGHHNIEVAETIYFIPLIIANRVPEGNIGVYDTSTILYNGDYYYATYSGVDIVPTHEMGIADYSQFIDFAHKDNCLYGIFKYNFGKIIPSAFDTLIYTVLYVYKYDFTNNAVTFSIINAGNEYINDYNTTYLQESFYNTKGFCLSDDCVIFSTGKTISKNNEDIEYKNGQIYLLNQSDLSLYGNIYNNYCRDIITYKTLDNEEYIYAYDISTGNGKLLAYNFLPSLNERYTVTTSNTLSTDVQLSAVETDGTVIVGIKDDILRFIDDSYYAGVHEDDLSWIHNENVNSPLLLDPTTVYNYLISDSPYPSIDVHHLDYNLKICDTIRYTTNTNDISAITLCAFSYDSLVYVYKHSDGTYRIQLNKNPYPTSFTVTETNEDDIGIDTNIIIKFACNIVESSFIPPYCSITYLNGSVLTHISYTYQILNSCEDGESRLEIIPNALLPEGKTITVSLSDDIQGVWGSYLTPYSFTFETLAKQNGNITLSSSLSVIKPNYSKSLKSTITILSPNYIASRMLNILPDIYNNSHSTNIYKIFYGVAKEYGDTIKMLSILYSDLYLKNWRVQSGTLLVNGRGMYEISFKSAFMVIPEISNMIIVPSQDDTPFNIYNITKYGFDIEILSDAVDTIVWFVIGQIGAIWEENFGDAIYNNHGALIDLERYLYFKPYVCPQLASLNDREVITLFTRDYTTPIYYQTHSPSSTYISDEKIWLRDTEIPRADYQYRRILKSVFASLVMGPTYNGILYGLSSFFKQPGFGVSDNKTYNLNAPYKFNLNAYYTIPDDIPEYRVGILINVIDLAQHYEFDDVNWETIISANAVRSVIGNLLINRYDQLYSIDVTSQARIWYQKFPGLNIDNNNGIMLKVNSELIDQGLIMKSIYDDDEIDKYPMLEIIYYDSDGTEQTFRIQTQQFIDAKNVFKTTYISPDNIDYSYYTFYLTGGTNPSRILIKFNLDILPQNIVIKSATLKLFFSSGITIQEAYKEKITLSETSLSKGKLFGPSYNKFRFNVYVYKYDLLDNSYPGDHAFGYISHEYEVNEVTDLILRKIKPSNTQYAIYYYKERVGIVPAGNIYEDYFDMKYFDKCFNNSAKGYSYVSPIEMNALKKISYLYNGKTFNRDF